MRDGQGPMLETSDMFGIHWWHVPHVLLRNGDYVPLQEQRLLPASRELGIPVMGGGVGGKLPGGGGACCICT